ncbi:MAG: hypothetical protein IJA95_00280 [Bacteroidaceae bacterium]|nr:hypothetical protein [Bacteroidaceae bacterium]
MHRRLLCSITTTSVCKPKWKRFTNRTNQPSRNFSTRLGQLLSGVITKHGKQRFYCNQYW